MLLPHVLSHFVLTSVPNSLTLVASHDLAEISCLIDAMNSCFVADPVWVSLEGYWAGILSAKESTDGGLLLS